MLIKSRPLLGADQWDVQPIIARVNQSLIARGYVTWFDLTNMKGSTMDAMSDAIEGSVLICTFCPGGSSSGLNVCFGALCDQSGRDGLRRESSV
jgi:hypothetical protein